MIESLVRFSYAVLLLFHGKWIIFRTLPIFFWYRIWTGPFLCDLLINFKATLVIVIHRVISKIILFYFCSVGARAQDLIGFIMDPKTSNSKPRIIKVIFSQSRWEGAFHPAKKFFWFPDVNKNKFFCPPRFIEGHWTKLKKGNFHTLVQL